MDAHWDYHTRWSKPDRGHISLICGILKKKRYQWTYLQNRNRLTDIENKLMITKEEREEGLISRSWGLTHIHDLFITYKQGPTVKHRNYIQNFAITSKGKIIGKRIYVYLKKNFLPLLSIHINWQCSTFLNYNLLDCLNEVVQFQYFYKGELLGSLSSKTTTSGISPSNFSETASSSFQPQISKLTHFCPASLPDFRHRWLS